MNVMKDTDALNELQKQNEQLRRELDELRAREQAQQETCRQLEEHALTLEAQLRKAEMNIRHERKARKQAEQKSRIMRNALDTMQLGVTITDVHGKILYVNPADSASSWVSA